MIRLREYEKQDAETNLKYANNPNVARFLLETFPSPYTLDDSIWWTSVGHKERLTWMENASDRLALLLVKWKIDIPGRLDTGLESPTGSKGMVPRRWGK